MITVTESAQEMIKAYFEDKELKPVRIFVSSGCGGAQMAMALDQVKPEDEVVTFDGVEYVMDKRLLGDAAPVNIDYVGTGFKIDCSLELGGGCSSCGSTGSCCS